MINLQATLSEHNENLDHGLPSGEGLTDYLGDFVDELNRAWRRIIGQETYGVVNDPVNADSAVKVLKKMGLLDSRKLEMVTPVIFEKRASTVYELLNEQLKKMVDVEKRLYRPLIQQFGKLITSPDAYNKAWIDDNIEFRDIDDLHDDLSDMFETKKKKNLKDSEIVDFEDLYDDAVDFGNCTKVLTRVKDTANLVNFTVLKSSEEKLVKLIESFVDEYEDNDQLEIKPHVTKRLVSVTQALARETEYLIALLHYANIFVVAHNDNVKTIEEL